MCFYMDGDATMSGEEECATYDGMWLDHLDELGIADPECCLPGVLVEQVSIDEVSKAECEAKKQKMIESLKGQIASLQNAPLSYGLATVHED